MPNKKKIALTLLGVLLIASTYSLWYLHQLRASPDAREALKDSDRVTVLHEDYGISFTPKANHNKTLLFYPGAFVDPVAYAPLCHKIAREGICCVIIEMPFRVALFGYTSPLNNRLFSDSTMEYFLVGHSHGAEMAAHFVFENPGHIDKLILLGTRYPEKISLAGSAIPVLKIYASNDGIETVQKVESNKHCLPENTRYVLLSGGNHAQFGDYTKQPFDHDAPMSKETQQELIFKHIIEFIHN